MHWSIPEQGKWLRQIVTGHFAYHAVPTNTGRSARSGTGDRPMAVHASATQPADGFTWDRMTKLADDWLPPPRILHPWPDERFAVKHPR